MTMTAERFQSKVDRWLAAILVIAVIMMLASLIGMAAGLMREPMVAVSAIAVFFGIVLIVWIGLATWYDVDTTTLKVVSGPFRWRIPLCDIRSVEETRSPFSAPALSLDRLRVHYGNNRCIVVSPRDKTRFIESLRLDAEDKAK